MISGTPAQPASQVTTNTQAPTATSESTSSESAMSKNEVQIKNFAFSPASITVKVGESVTWTNQDSVGHSATADDNSFDTGVFSQGKSGSFTFSKAGTYTYHCSVHPNMKATVVVQ
ncbi:cupredoxin family copper-binding protein [Candidatus Daviesbacteria bacterium]|nr:cupredoxin family copper-binding protein [Candidatus Daviesbacteria bacterium]